MPLQTTAVALQACADQIRLVAAGLETAVQHLLAADEEVRSKLRALEDQVARLEQDCA